eukprot:TRINITY_DN552_c0_g1_i1.p1 TRINITY_DN552_c0_g1~~TRINITY_DN552_c0_g1_i1.p1  ORF type:complete len:302 (-),score=76.27 TRINITY_DN552_c0_g1_i1:31-936(-)
MNAKALLVLIATIACVSGHAVLRNPSAWNGQPSTASPCGISPGVTPDPIAAATWPGGSNQAIEWEQVASDGAGTVVIVIDPTGSNNPSPTAAANIELSSFTTSSNQKYNNGFTIPNTVNCTGPGGLCTLMVHTNNWWSCAYVNITNCPGCPTPPEPAPKCTAVGTNLKFCSSKNGRSALLPVGKNPSSLDTQTYATYAAYLKNPNVFGANNSACLKAYTTFLCDVNFPACGTGSDSDHAVAGQPCHSECVAAMDACQLQPQHANLYDCEDTTQYLLCPAESSANVVAVAFAAVVLAVAALL